MTGLELGRPVDQAHPGYVNRLKQSPDKTDFGDARLAVAAPWAMLLLLSLRTDAVRAYNSPTGVLVLAIGGGVSLLAYRLMVRIGRLPEERRVLR